jgi:hypothetical protein
MLTVQLACLYWDKKAFWMTVWLNTGRFSAAIIGCGTVATLLLDSGWNKAAAVIAAALAFYLSIVDPKSALDQAVQAREAYRALFAEYETLWGRILVGLPDLEINDTLERLRKEALRIKEPLTRLSKRLRDESFNEILAARGLVNA